MKIFICTNILTSVSAAPYLAHCNFWYRLGLMNKNNEHTFYAMTPPRMAIDQARNWAARMALENECDYLMFIDDDMLIMPNTLQSLLDCDLDIVMAHTYIRGNPFNEMSFILKEGRLEYAASWKERVNDKGVFLCDAVGFAVCLIKMDLIRKMEAPYFVTGTGHTEDIYFCVKARTEISADVSIGVDTKVPTGHMLHPEAVNMYNVDQLRAHYKELKKEEPENDRGNEYYKQINGVLGEA